jgi:hypothetical protein
MVTPASSISSKCDSPPLTMYDLCLLIAVTLAVNIVEL